jgi:hypothetical protein
MAKAYLIDLDGVLVKGRPDIPGAHVATGVTPIQFKPNRDCSVGFFLMLQESAFSEFLGKG